MGKSLTLLPLRSDLGSFSFVVGTQNEMDLDLGIQAPLPSTTPSSLRKLDVLGSTNDSASDGVLLMFGAEKPQRNRF
ncbi:unnamed protein product [Haemonchus placei]|uniref:Uncharacterized protein n=1 Tax=Haemonchus placei TaxID=6290 RepID=A0A0N4W1S5_HAEPC|nr:unnamed protein product [Haemonchus placei]